MFPFNCSYKAITAVNLWVIIIPLLQKVVGLPLSLDPIQCLLGLPFLGKDKPVRRLIIYILLAAKRTIPLYWLSTAPPSQQHLLQLIAEMRRMEYLTATVHEAVPHFNKIREL